MIAAAVSLLILLGLMELAIVVVLLTFGGRKARPGARRPLQSARAGGTPATRLPAPQPNARSPYERIPALLTAAERDFFAGLRDATPPAWLLSSTAPGTTAPTGVNTTPLSIRRSLGW